MKDNDENSLAGVLAFMFSDDGDVAKNIELISAGLETLIEECSTAKAAIGAALGVAMGCAILGDEVEAFTEIAKQICEDRERFEELKVSFFKAMAQDDPARDMDESPETNTVH